MMAHRVRLKWDFLDSGRRRRSAPGSGRRVAQRSNVVPSAVITGPS